MGCKARIHQDACMVDSDTKKIYAVSITDEKSGDTLEFKKLLDEALQNIENSPNVTSSGKLHLDAMVHMIPMIILMNVKREM